MGKCEHDDGVHGYVSLHMKDCPYCRIEALEELVASLEKLMVKEREFKQRRIDALEGRLRAYELHYGVMSGAAIQHILNSGHGNNLTEKEWIEAKSEQEGE